MRIALMGDMSAADALAAANTGAANTAAVVATADAPASNGFPGFSAIWDKVFGIAQGILKASPTVASVTPAPTVVTVAKPSDAIPFAVMAGVLGLSALYIMTPAKKKRRR